MVNGQIANLRSTICFTNEPMPLELLNYLLAICFTNKLMANELLN